MNNKLHTHRWIVSELPDNSVCTVHSIGVRYVSSLDWIMIVSTISWKCVLICMHKNTMVCFLLFFLCYCVISMRLIHAHLLWCLLLRTRDLICFRLCFHFTVVIRYLDIFLLLTVNGVLPSFQTSGQDSLYVCYNTWTIMSVF